MKPPEEIIRFIDDYNRRALERPSMYAATPEALEEVLRLLDALREFIVRDDTAFSWDSPYHRFLQEQGYGPSTFTGRRRLPRPNPEQEPEAFRRLADFWKEYVAWREQIGSKRNTPP